MSSDKRRVQFRASEKLVERADVLATVLGTDRTEVVTDALREYLRDAAGDDRLVQEIAGAYYDEEITFDQLRELVGPERAANFRVLKRQLDEDLTEEPHIEGSRLTVRLVHERVEKRGLSPERIAERHGLDIADIYEALAYYRTNPETMRRVEARHERAVATAEERSSLTSPSG